MSAHPPLALPPWTETASGSPRRVGVELEMIGPDVTQVTEVVARVVGGTVRPVSRYEQGVASPSGDWGIELDYELLKDWGREAAANDDETSTLDGWIEGVVRVGAEAVVPVEVVSPPLPMTGLRVVQEIVGELRAIGAQGTGAGLAYAFGMQLNPEVPGLDVATILAYLQSFACLQDWLFQEARMDFTRRLTGYSAPFPGKYVRRLVAPDYAPDLSGLIDDYLHANPTRNRALDCLPLFLHLDAERVRRVVDDERVKPRPTFHYRLPNSEIDDPDWGIHVPWGSWLEVERLAANDDARDELCERRARLESETFLGLRREWAEEVARWIDRSSE